MINFNYSFFVFFCLSILLVSHQTQAQSIPEQANTEQETYLLNDIEVLNQIRQLQKDLEELEKELERAQATLERFQLDRNIPDEALTDRTDEQ